MTKLLDLKTGKWLSVGDTVTTFTGERGTLIAWTKPRHEGSTGRVTLSFAHGGWTQEFYPSVIDARIVEVN